MRSGMGECMLAAALMYSIVLWAAAVTACWAAATCCRCGVVCYVLAFVSLAIGVLQVGACLI
jgi:hypothetical protein